MYLDNFYNSYQLNLELYVERHVCGRHAKVEQKKENSKAVVTAKIEKRVKLFTEGMVQYCVWGGVRKKEWWQWYRQFIQLFYVEVKKKYSDEKIMKPLAVYDYTQRMAGGG